MIFISYSREDAVDAGKIARELQDQGYDILKDPSLIEGDPFWRCQVKQNFKKCDLMIILWSDAAARSPWVDEEIKAFRGIRAFIKLDETQILKDYNPAELHYQNIPNFLKSHW